MSKLPELTHRFADRRAELAKVRHEIALDRKGLANREAREATLVDEMNAIQSEINQIIEEDKCVGLPVDLLGRPLTYAEVRAFEAAVADQPQVILPPADGAEPEHNEKALEVVVERLEVEGRAVEPAF